MKISTKGRYALRMLIDLAEHQEDGFVALKDIAERQNISKKYLEQIVPILNKSGVLQASRGFQGGYRMVGTPADYTIAFVLRMTEGSLAPISCLDYNPRGCDFRAQCPTFDMWVGLDKVISDYLEGITIQDLLDKKHYLGENSYCI